MLQAQGDQHLSIEIRQEVVKGSFVSDLSLSEHEQYMRTPEYQEQAPESEVHRQSACCASPHVVLLFLGPRAWAQQHILSCLVLSCGLL